MVDVRRLWGILCATGLVLSCLAVAEGLFAASSRFWPMPLRNDWGAVEFPAYTRCSSQISGVVKQGYAGGKPIGLLLGASGQAFAIDRSLLEAEVNPHVKWLELTIYAGTPCELEGQARRLIKSQIRPAIVLVNIALKMLARSETYRKFDTIDMIRINWSNISADFRSMRIRALESHLESLVSNAFNTLFADRTKINYRLNNQLVRLRTFVLDRCGQGIRADYAPAEHPWDDPSPRDLKPWPPEDVPAKLAESMAYHQNEGRFDSRLYSTDQDSSASFVRLIRLVRSVGAEVVVVIMPERSTSREALPVEARHMLSRLLEEAFEDSPPRVIDLESAVPDDHMMDTSHVDTWGKTVVTRRLIEELNRR
jgi:hypothetical protein